MVFNVFGSRDLPRDPQETQEPPKKHPKSSKGPKKIAQKKSQKMPLVKNALSRRSRFGRFLVQILVPKIALFVIIS